MHVAVRCDADDRKSLEQLWRHITRPPLTSSVIDQPVGEELAEDASPAILEIGAADLPAFGYITKLGRRVTLDPQAKSNEQYVQEHDIVLIVKAPLERGHGLRCIPGP